MITTKKYWIEMLQAFFSTDTEDEKIILDDYDCADYLQMAVETTIIDVLQGRYKGAQISAMAVWYRGLAVTGATTTLPFSPVMQDSGIITVNNNGIPLMPRSEGVESTAMGILKGKSLVPTYVVDGTNMTWEYAPEFTTVDVFMVPMLTNLEDDDEYKLPAGIKDIVFTRCRALAKEKLQFKPHYKNNTHVGDQPV